MKPEHSWYSHAADALRTFAVGYQEDVDEALRAAKIRVVFQRLHVWEAVTWLANVGMAARSATPAARDRPSPERRDRTHSDLPT